MPGNQPTLTLSLALASALSISATPAIAESIGQIGPLHPIVERDFLEMIQARLKAKEASGEIARLQKEAVDRVKHTIEHPDPLGIPWAKTARTGWYDPAQPLLQDVVNDKGEVIHAAGTRVNPLDYIGLTKTLLFFDARDPRQVEWARQEMLKGPAKPILTGGSYMALMRNWKKPVYFDQHGRLTARLGVKSVPARVTQEGRALKIEEIPMEGAS